LLGFQEKTNFKDLTLEVSSEVLDSKRGEVKGLETLVRSGKRFESSYSP